MYMYILELRFRTCSKNKLQYRRPSEVGLQLIRQFVFLWKFVPDFADEALSCTGQWHHSPKPFPAFSDSFSALSAPCLPIPRIWWYSNTFGPVLVLVLILVPLKNFT